MGKFLSFTILILFSVNGVPGDDGISQIGYKEPDFTIKELQFANNNCRLDNQLYMCELEERETITVTVKFQSKLPCEKIFSIFSVSKEPCDVTKEGDLYTTVMSITIPYVSYKIYFKLHWFMVDYNNENRKVELPIAIMVKDGQAIKAASTMVTHEMIDAAQAPITQIAYLNGHQMKDNKEVDFIIKELQFANNNCTLDNQLYKCELEERETITVTVNFQSRVPCEKVVSIFSVSKQFRDVIKNGDLYTTVLDLTIPYVSYKVWFKLHWIMADYNNENRKVELPIAIMVKDGQAIKEVKAMVT